LTHRMKCFSLVSDMLMKQLSTFNMVSIWLAQNHKHHITCNRHVCTNRKYTVTKLADRPFISRCCLANNFLMLNCSIILFCLKITHTTNIINMRL